jgi:hypothetical protein
MSESTCANCGQQKLHAETVVSSSVQDDRGAIDGVTEINTNTDYDAFYKRLVDPDLAPSDNQSIGTYVYNSQSSPTHDSERPISRKVKTVGRSDSNVSSGSDQSGPDPLPPTAFHRRKRPREQTCAVQPTTAA